MLTVHPHFTWSFSYESKLDGARKQSTTVQRLAYSKVKQPIISNSCQTSLHATLGKLYLTLAFFQQCNDPEGIRSSEEITPNRETCESINYTWTNAEVHFDHVPMAYLALFQVATWKGWIQIMNDAIDTVAVSRGGTIMP